MLYIIFSFTLALIDVWLIEFYLSKNFSISDNKSNRLIHILAIIVIFISHLYTRRSNIISTFIMLPSLIILIKNYQIPRKEIYKYFFLFLVLEIIVSNCINFVLNWTFDLQLNTFLLNWSLTYIILIEAIIRYVQLLIIILITNKNTKKNITLHNFKGFSFFLSIYFGIALVINNDKLFIFPNIGRTFIFVIIVYNIALIFFDKFQNHHEQLEYEHNQLVSETSSESLYFQEHLSGNDDMRGIRHDMKNYMLVLHGFVSSHQTETALAYIRNIQSQIEIASFTLHTGIVCLDSIITNKIKTMQKNNIEYKEVFKVIELGVVFDTDLAMMIASALDNAIDAAILSEDKRISLDISTEANYLCVTITNSIKRNSKPNFKKSSKADPSKHGYGYKKIKSVVKKYNGNIDTEITKDKVIMLITLRID